MSQKTPKKKKKGSLIIKLILILVILLGIAFAVFYFYMKQQSNPVRIANRYVESFMSKDTSALFQELDYTTDTFTTPETLKASLDECHNYSKLTTYSLLEIANATDEDTKTFSVQYWDDDHQNSYTQTLTLQKSDTNLYFIFDNWEIQNSEFLAKNCSVGAPDGAKVTVDDIELTEDKMKESETTGTVIYDLGNMFVGTHKISITLDGFDVYETSVFLTGKDYKKQTIYTTTSSMMTVSSDMQKTLTKNAESAIKNLYTFALKKKSFDALAEKVPFESTSVSLLKQKYDALVTNNISSTTHLTKVDFTSFTSSSSTTYAEDGCYALNVIVDAKYSTNSTVFKETPALDGGEPTPSTLYRSGSSSSLFTVTFHYKDGAWAIFDTTALDACIYYVKY